MLFYLVISLVLRMVFIVILNGAYVYGNIRTAGVK